MRECGNWGEHHGKKRYFQEASEMCERALHRKTYDPILFYQKLEVMVWPKVILSSLVAGLAPKFREQAEYSVTVGTQGPGIILDKADVCCERSQNI